MSTTPETDPVDSTGTVDPVPATPDASAPAAPSAAPDVDTESATEGGPDSDSQGPDVEAKVDPAKEKAEKEKLEKAMELIMKVAKEGDKSSIGVDTLAEAALFFRNSFLTKPFWAAWNLAPAILQRELAMTEQTAVGEFFMRYLTPLNPRAYFMPGLFLAALARIGVLKFKMNDEEAAKMKAELGENPEEAAKIAYAAKMDEEIIGRIVLPGEGVTKIVTGPLGKIVATVKPELAPVVAVAKVGEVIEGARNGYFDQVRNHVHAMEVVAAQEKAAKEAAEAKAKAGVAGTVAIEHTAMEADLKPEVTLTPAPTPAPANNADHHNEAAAA